MRIILIYRFFHRATSSGSKYIFANCNGFSSFWTITWVERFNHMTASHHCRYCGEKFSSWKGRKKIVKIFSFQVNSASENQQSRWDLCSTSTAATWRDCVVDLSVEFSNNRIIWTWFSARHLKVGGNPINQLTWVKLTRMSRSCSMKMFSLTKFLCKIHRIRRVHSSLHLSSHDSWMCAAIHINKI